jgi:hypothetical protein
MIVRSPARLHDEQFGAVKLLRGTLDKADGLRLPSKKVGGSPLSLRGETVAGDG